MTLRHGPLAGLLVLAAVAGARPALAGDPAAAQALFSEARQKMQRGDYATACPQLEESERIDPAVGTLFHLADCDEHLGKTATAWALFLEVADKTRAAGQPAREQAARDRAGTLSARLSRVVLVAAGQRTSGLEIRRDGTLVSPAQWGLALPVDPGTHTFSARAPGRRAWRSTVEVAADGGTTTVNVPDLAADDDGGSSSPSTDPREAALDEATGVDLPSGPEAARHLSTRRLVAEVLVGAGGAGVGVGAAYGIVSWAKHSESNSGCSRANVCTPTAGAARSDAIGAGNISTAAFAVGVALAAVGAVLWITEPSPSGSGSGPGLPRSTVSGTRIGLEAWPSGAGIVGTFR